MEKLIGACVKMTCKAWSSCAHVSSKYLFASQAGCGFSALTTSFVEPFFGVNPLLSLPERRRLVLVDCGVTVASLVENEYISDCIWTGCVLGFLRSGEESIGADWEAPAEACAENRFWIDDFRASEGSGCEADTVSADAAEGLFRFLAGD